MRKLIEFGDLKYWVPKNKKIKPKLLKKAMKIDVNKLIDKIFKKMGES